MVMLDGLDLDCRRDVRFARAGSADQNDVVGVVEEVAAMKLADERLVDLAAGKIKAIQITIGRKASCFELIGRRTNFTFRGVDRGAKCSLKCARVGDRVFSSPTTIFRAWVRIGSATYCKIAG